MDLDGAVYRELTGQRRTKQTTRGILNDSKEAFGTWKEVARQSGISERTLRRMRQLGKWVGTRASRQKLNTLGHRQEVRQAGMKPAKRRKLDRARRNGARIKVKSNQGPRGAGAGDYRRVRTLDFHVPAADMDRLITAYETGNDSLVKSIMEDIVSDYAWSDWTPPGGWVFGSMDEFDITPD